MTGHHVDMKADVDYHEALYVLPTFGERTDVWEAIEMDKPEDTHQRL